MYRCYYKVNLINLFITFNPPTSYKRIADMATIKKSLLFTVHIVNNKITCIRCNLTGKFVSIKKYLAKQKANVILSNAKTNKLSNGYLSLFVMFIFIAIAYSLCYSTIKERQEYYNNWNNSNE